MSNQDIVILSAVRTPIGKFGGTLLPFNAAALGGFAAKAAIQSSGVPAQEFGEVIFGHARQAGGGPNTARQVVKRAGLATTVPAFTVNKACASGLKSITLAAQSIMSGEADFVLAGGTESMSNTPYLLTNARWGSKLGNSEIIDAMYRDGFQCPLSELLMGQTAENLAGQYKISRQEQDEFALESQRRAGEAQKAGRFANEIVPIEVQGKKEIISFKEDEHLRPDTTLDSLKKLPPVFDKTGTVTAGNASGITDGAAALVLGSEKKAKALSLKPLARIKAWTSVGVDPAIMGIGPVPAVKKLLEKTKLKLSDIGLIELNEAFAAQIIACQRDLKYDAAICNVNGGSIALGHPIGATGARISVTLIHEMKRRQIQFGIATLCVSGGMGMAVLYENL